jgi:hypothetical protein
MWLNKEDRSGNKEDRLSNKVIETLGFNPETLEMCCNDAGASNEIFGVLPRTFRVCLMNGGVVFVKTMVWIKRISKNCFFGVQCQFYKFLNRSLQIVNEDLKILSALKNIEVP